MKVLNYIIIVATALIAIACAKNKGDDAKKVANTPVPTSDCMLVAGSSTNSTCLYDYSRHSGFRNYMYNTSYNTGYSSGLCGCQSGYQPVYNNTWGLGCVESRYTTSSNYIYYSWNSTNTHWVNIPQTAPSIPSTGSCVGDAMYACDPAMANTCGAYGTCLAVGGSRLGVCQYRNGYNYYSTSTTGGWSGGWSGGVYYYNSFN